jgi:hypothetical protein
MQRDQGIAFGQTVPRTLHGSKKKSDERIEHHVADPQDSFLRNALVLKIDIGVFGWSK